MDVDILQLRQHVQRNIHRNETEWQRVVFWIVVGAILGTLIGLGYTHPWWR